MKSRKIKTKLTYSKSMFLGGWYQGKNTYLWFGSEEENICLGYLDGPKLYRLAKAIVKNFENA